MFDKFLINTGDLDEVEKVSLVSVIMFTILYIIVHAVFFIWFSIMDIPEMAHMNIVSILVALLNIWLLTDVKKQTMGGYLLIINFCYYVVYSTYLLGYSKDATMLFPLIILLLHTLFPKQGKYLAGSTIILMCGFFVNMYLKYNHVAKYEDSLDYVDWINYLYAFTVVFMFIYTRSVAENIVNNYTKQIDKITEEANVDFLTGLYNRRFIEKRFKAEEFNGSYIVLGDIDFFKKINDTYGHNCGDYVIKEIAQILKTSFRATDDVCRWGGEEFMIYIRDAYELDIEKKLNEVREAIAQNQFKYNDIKFKITMTLGYSAITDEFDISQNIERADTALYHGKETGRNKVVCYNDIKDMK